MKRNCKTRIYAIIGAAALSCSMAPIKPSMITTHAGSDTPVSESAQENTTPPDSSGTPDSSVDTSDNTQNSNSVNPSEIPADNSAKPSELPDTPSASPSEVPDNTDFKPGEASTAPGQSSSDEPDNDIPAEPTTVPDAIPTEAPNESPSTEEPDDIPDTPDISPTDTPDNNNSTPVETPSGSDSLQTDAPDGNDATPGETPLAPGIIPTTNPEDSENADPADKKASEEVNSTYYQDQQKPEISYERIEKEDGQYAHITVSDPGDNASGIKDCQITVDGENRSLSETAVLMSLLPDGQETVVKLEYEIPLDGDILHEIQVQVTDNAGNVASELISMKAVNDVIEVIIPASFNITIWPYGEKDRQIYSDDIVICNQSNFPVDISITDVSLTVEHSLPDDFQDIDGISKDCNVSLQLCQMNLEPINLLLNEGNNGNIASFSLSAKQEGTDPQQLLQTQPVDTITNPDFAVFRLFGNVSEGSESVWQNGDLKVRLTFEFHKRP